MQADSIPTKEPLVAGRSSSMTIELPALPDVVWRALTDAQELARWFPLSASVKPAAGGEIVWDWGELYHWPLKIDVWEPGRRLRLLQERDDIGDTPMLLTTEFVLEGHGGTTTLRVVAAGFGKTKDWDDEYDGVRRGWQYELRSLRHYLTYHQGKERQVAWGRVMTPMSTAEIRRTLLATGLDLLVEGDRYRLELRTGDVFEGMVVRNEAPHDFAGTAVNWNNGLFRFEVWGGGVILWLSAYGVDAGKVAAQQRRFETLLGKLK